MKLFAFIVLALALFLAIATVSAVRTLAEVDEFSSPHLSEANIVTGKVHHLLLAHETWQRFPALPLPAAMFVDVRALGFMAVASFIVIYVARIKFRMPYSIVGLLALSAAVVPYLYSVVALADNTNPEKAGPQMAVMVLSVLYGALVCAVLALIDLVSSRYFLRFALSEELPLRPPSGMHVGSDLT